MHVQNDTLLLSNSYAIIHIGIVYFNTMKMKLTTLFSLQGYIAIFMPSGQRVNSIDMLLIVTYTLDTLQIQIADNNITRLIRSNRQ
jgi:hypothetical protein